MRLWFQTYSIHHIQLAGSDYASSTVNNASQLAGKLNSGFQGYSMLNFRFAAPTAAPKNPLQLDNFLVLLVIDHFSVHQLDAQPFFNNEVDSKHLSTNTTESSWKRNMSSGRRFVVRIAHENDFVPFKRKLEDEFRKSLAIATDFALLDYENMYNKNQ